MAAVSHHRPAQLYVRWSFTLAALQYGWWLVAGLYLVLDAGLTPLELVLLGTFQGIASLVSEVPAGVLADTVSRRRSLVVAHVLMAAGMGATGLFTNLWPLVLTQVVWGVGGTFSSGADVAWVTDEMKAAGATDHQVAQTLTRGARWGQIGAACGILALGAAAWVTSLTLAIFLAGAAMAALGLVVAARFPEAGFRPEAYRTWRTSIVILRRGLRLARRDVQIARVLLVTVLIHGAAEAYVRLFPKQLVDLGLPPSAEPIVWLTALGLGALAAGALALRAGERALDRHVHPAPLLAASAAVGGLGLVGLALAPSAALAALGVLLMSGIALSTTRAMTTVWVNQRTTSEVRATVHSLVAQAEYAGEITLGFGLALLAERAGIPVSFHAAALAMLLAAAGAWPHTREAT